jgi:hypothetical protein
MTTKYNNTSPYFTTAQTTSTLDIWNPRPIPPQATDQTYTIDKLYANKPHLLAYDLYQDSRLWWVFAVRNKDIIKDPIYDFVAGLEIKVTPKDVLMSILNV